MQVAIMKRFVQVSYNCCSSLNLCAYLLELASHLRQLRCQIRGWGGGGRGCLQEVEFELLRTNSTSDTMKVLSEDQT